MIALLSGPIAHAAPHLEVHGTSHFDVRSTHAAGTIAVTATLLDDTDRPLEEAAVAVRFTSTIDGHALPAVPCNARRTESRGDVVTVTTALDGTLCAESERQADGSTGGAVGVTLTFEGTHLVKGTELSTVIDPSRVTVELTLDPLPRGATTLTVGEGEVTLDAVATLDDPALSPANLRLSLWDEKKTHLADAVTSARGVAHFVVPDALLGAVGPATLQLTYDGDVLHAKAARELPAERRVHVTIHPRDLESDGRAHADETESGAAVDLDVTTTRGAPAPGGSVEGFVDGAVVGAAPVVAGHARLIVTDPGSAGRYGASIARVTARYVPDVPWYLAGSPAVLDLHVAHTLLARRIGILVLGLTIFAWFFLARSRFFALRDRKPQPMEANAHVETARIEVLATHDDARTSWEGHILDAHDGEPVAGAVILLDRPAFASSATVARTTSDARGRFVLEAPEAKAGDQISVEAPLHQRLVRPAPARGIVQVALVSRRRGVLRRLIEHAKARGWRFAPSADPTPADIRRARANEGDEKTARWAGAVEGAAFGPADVDARAEAEIDRLGHETHEGS